MPCLPMFTAYLTREKDTLFRLQYHVVDPAQDDMNVVGLTTLVPELNRTSPESSRERPPGFQHT